MLGQSAYAHEDMRCEGGHFEIILPGLTAGQYLIEARTEKGIEAANLIVE
jgi:hypothetical protein